MTVHLDISQLVLDPRRTGIQRAERELIRHWPGPAALRACRFDPASGRMLELPDSILGVLCEDAPAGGGRAELAQLEAHLRPERPARPNRLLSAELFSDPGRAAYYGKALRGQRTYWLVYDFLPWLHPDWFSVGSSARLMPYLHALGSVDEVAFISRRTKEEYIERITRRASDGPVIPMGGDGLALERQTFGPGRRDFVMLGTIEPRKNAAVVMQAFMRLWREGVEAALVMIGAVSPDAGEELALLQALAGERRFRHLRNLSDAGVRDVLRGARALVFPSTGEGYGIPPMEALHAGIPVVVSSELPALAGQPALGQIRLDVVSADRVLAAVRTLLDDAEAARLWRSAAEMEVPGWADFGRSVGQWVQG